MSMLPQCRSNTRAHSLVSALDAFTTSRFSNILDSNLNTLLISLKHSVLNPVKSYGSHLKRHDKSVEEHALETGIVGRENAKPFEVGTEISNGLYTSCTGI